MLHKMIYGRGIHLAFGIGKSDVTNGSNNSPKSRHGNCNLVNQQSSNGVFGD